MTRSDGSKSGSIILPSVRKEFWEFLISRHPIEENYAKSTKNAYRWRSIPQQRLVIVQFVSEHGVGVFIRGEKGANPDDLEHRLQPYAPRLKKALGVQDFYFSREGVVPAKFFFQKFRNFRSSRRANWGKMADWLHREAGTYQTTLHKVLGSKVKRKNCKDPRDNNATSRYKLDRKSTRFEQRMTEPMDLQADGSIKTYTPEEWEPMGLQADGSIETYTPEEWEKLEAALRIGSYSPEVWKQAKAVMRFKWRRGYDDAMAGRPMPERALYEYFEGYDAGKAKLSKNSAPSKG